MSMERKRKKQQTGAATISIISDEKEILKEALPALALPNSDPTNILTELEGLIPMWKDEQVMFFGINEDL